MPTPSPNQPDSEHQGDQRGLSAWTRLLQRHRWLPFVLPYVVFTVTGYLLEPRVSQNQSDTETISPRDWEPDRARPAGEPDGSSAGATLGYPLAYSLRVLATLAAVVAVFPIYRSVPWRARFRESGHVPLRVGWLAVAVGVAGGFAWILICRLGFARYVFSTLGVAGWLSLGERQAFDPLSALGDSPAILVAFLTVRFVGLTAIVPLIEEFFLRGFLMRFFQTAQWWTIPLGSVTAGSAIIATAYGVLAHPAEPFASAVWFTLITLLYARTRNLWDCVIAHGVTNAMLGAYVLIWKDWTLW